MRNFVSILEITDDQWSATCTPLYANLEDDIYDKGRNCEEDEELLQNGMQRRLPAFVCSFASEVAVPAVFALVRVKQIYAAWDLEDLWCYFDLARTLAMQASWNSLKAYKGQNRITSCVRSYPRADYPA